MKYLLPLSLLAFSTVIFAADKPDDNPPPVPLGWKPPTARPAFVERLQGAEFTKRFDAALAKINVAELEKSPLPAEGVRVVHVFAQSPAEKIGLQIGDVLATLDKTPMRAAWQLVSRNKTQAAHFTWVNAAGETKQGDIPPGRLGISQNDYFRPDLAYLRGNKRDPKWEKYVLVAASAFTRDPDLAETCLLKAVAAGFDHPLLDQMGLFLAAVQLRHDRAMSFAWQWMKADPGAFLPAGAFQTLASASFQPQAVAACGQMPLAFRAAFPNFPPVFEQLQTRVAAMPPEILKLPPPCVAAEKLIHHDLVYRMEQHGRQQDAIATGLYDVQNMAFNPATGMYQCFTFGPDAEDIDVQFFMDARKSDDETSDFSKCAGVTILDRENPEFEELSQDGRPAGVFGIAMESPNYISINGPAGSFATEIMRQDPVFDIKNGNLYRITIHKERGEVQINGKRVYYGPIGTSSKHRVFSMKAVGMTLRCVDIRVCELVDPSDKTRFAEVNKRGRDGLTWIMRCADMKYFDDIPRLVENGADITLKDDLQRTVMEHAAWNGSKAAVDFLVSKGVKADLFALAATGQTDKIRELLKADPTLASKALPCGYTAFLGAVANNHLETAKVLAECPIDVNAHDPNGVTALMYAALNRSKEMMALVLSKNPDVAARDKYGRTAAYAVRDNPELTQQLKAGAAAIPPPKGDF